MKKLVILFICLIILEGGCGNIKNEKVDKNKIDKTKVNIFIDDTKNRHFIYEINILSNGKEFNGQAVFPMDKTITTDDEGKAIIYLHKNVEYTIKVYKKSDKAPNDKTKNIGTKQKPLFLKKVKVMEDPITLHLRYN